MDETLSLDWFPPSTIINFLTQFAADYNEDVTLDTAT